MQAPLIAADMPWLLYRGYFALPSSITDDRGRPVNALLGAVNVLLTAVQSCRPRAIAACMGAEDALYRVKLYPPYHAHRDPMPADLAWQFKQAPMLLSSFGWTVFDSEELEADDVMFSCSLAETRSGGRTLLLSGDRDMFQAVDDQVAVLELHKERVVEIGPPQVRERCGVGPYLIGDLIALRGDPSDGIPGAPGIGQKTAADLLRRHGSLEGVLSDAQDPRSRERPRIRAILNEHAEQLRLFKRVATLVDLEIKRTPDRQTDYLGGASAARELGMRRLAARLEELAQLTA